MPETAGVAHGARSDPQAQRRAHAHDRRGGQNRHRPSRATRRALPRHRQAADAQLRTRWRHLPPPRGRRRQDDPQTVSRRSAIPMTSCVMSPTWCGSRAVSRATAKVGATRRCVAMPETPDTSWASSTNSFGVTARLATSARHQLHREIDELERRIRELADEDRRAAERPGLDGNAVMEQLGVGPGRDVGDALDLLARPQAPRRRSAPRRTQSSPRCVVGSTLKSNTVRLTGCVETGRAVPANRTTRPASLAWRPGRGADGCCRIPETVPSN